MQTSNPPRRHTLPSIFPPIVKNVKVLLVEDNEIIQYVMDINLKELGCHVDIANDGEQAINMYPNGYDIIFMDIGLPKIGGIEVTQAIRAQEREQGGHTIIVATTVLGDLVIKECKEAGVDDFYNKPLLQKDLVVILKRWSPAMSLCQPVTLA